MAAKRLPRPGTGISIATSSGVSMLSWSHSLPLSFMSQVLSNRWIQKRTPYWDRLGALVASAQASTGAGVRQLTRAELREMALLYRQVASDLSTLRQDRTSAALAAQVNALLARAHHIIYSSRKGTWRTFWLFLRDGYPREFRRQIGY